MTQITFPMCNTPTSALKNLRQQNWNVVTHSKHSGLLSNHAEKVQNSLQGSRDGKERVGVGKTGLHHTERRSLNT